MHLGRRAMTRLRCGTNELRLHTGRFDGTPEVQRLCVSCIDIPAGVQHVEDERHFLLECEYHQQGRIKLWRSLTQIVAEYRRQADGDDMLDSPFNAGRLSADERFTLLTGGSHPSIVGAPLVRRAMSAVLITIAQWTDERARQHDRLKRAIIEQVE